MPRTMLLMEKYIATVCIKDTIKQLGFRWDGYLKLWYIPGNKFTQDLYNKAKEATKFESQFPASGRWGKIKGYTRQNFAILYKSIEEINRLKRQLKCEDEQPQANNENKLQKKNDLRMTKIT
jgi:hypothetical protein